MILPVLGLFVDHYGRIGYARGFVVLAVLSALCALISYGLKRTRPGSSHDRGSAPAH